VTMDSLYDLKNWVREIQQNNWAHTIRHKLICYIQLYK